MLLLSWIALEKRPFEIGESICTLTDRDPADWPAMVTRLGSPPKTAMLACTHFNAAF
jgi:hypothetical protein